MSKQNSKKFNDVLDICLDRLLAGETVEQCLQDYPEFAAELEPLLCTARTIKQASAVQPALQFRESSRRQFLMALRESRAQKVPRFAFWHPGWVAVPLAIAVMLLAGGGTVAAAQQVMPDHVLYPVKVASENALLTLTRSPTGKAELAARLADKRVMEIIVMADKGKPEQVQKATEQMDAYLEQVANFAATSTGRARVASAPAATVPSTTAAPRAPAPQTQGALVAPKPTPAPAPAPPAVAAVPSPTKSDQYQDKGASKEDKVGKSSETKTPAKTTAANVKNNQAKLKEALVRKAMENPAALRSMLRQASPSVKPALERAIAIAEKRYREALDNLDDDK